MGIVKTGNKWRATSGFSISVIVSVFVFVIASFFVFVIAIVIFILPEISGERLQACPSVLLSSHSQSQ